jgi:hypothetical protein
MYEEYIGKNITQIPVDIKGDMLKFRVPTSLMDPSEARYNEGFLVCMFNEIFITPDHCTAEKRRLYLLDVRHCDLTEIVVIEVIQFPLLASE